MSSRRTKTPAPIEKVGRSSFGDALRDLRNAKNVRLRELSDVLKVSLPFLSDVENGRRPLSENRIKAAAKHLDADPLPLLELAAKDRGKIVLDVTTLDDKRLRVAMLLMAAWPNVSDTTVDYLLRNLKVA